MVENYAKVPIALFALTAAIKSTKKHCIYHHHQDKAIKNQTLGEMSTLQLGMWRKTEVKCWQADVLADNT